MKPSGRSRSALFRGDPGMLEFEILGDKGTRRWLETHAVPLRNAKDEIIAELSITRDITKQKQVREALRKSEASLVNAQRIAHLGNWEWDVIENGVHWSDEVYRIFGLIPTEFWGYLRGVLEFRTSG